MKYEHLMIRAFKATNWQNIQEIERDVTWSRKTGLKALRSTIFLMYQEHAANLNNL